MTSVLQAADRTPEQLTALLTALNRAKDSHQLRCWIEAPDGWAFDWWPGVDGNLRWCAAARNPLNLPARDAFQRATGGRLFARDGELRWRVIPALGNACCRIVFLGTSAWVGDALDNHSTELASLESKMKQHILWGQQTAASPEEWIELRIPHRFRYPIEGNPRGVKLVTEYWIDAVGQPHFIRLCDLQPFEETA
ncbi:MAG: hypothetical protein WD049_05550 [Candidatus Paceibacterota bacterium]